VLFSSFDDLCAQVLYPDHAEFSRPDPEP
jgi:hypothetical protein